jgi:hypothetical protein
MDGKKMEVADVSEPEMLQCAVEWLEEHSIFGFNTFLNQNAHLS